MCEEPAETIEDLNKDPAGSLESCVECETLE